MHIRQKFFTVLIVSLVFASACATTADDPSTTALAEVAAATTTPPTNAPEPSPTISQEPTAQPLAEPTAEPADEPTAQPLAEPTAEPADEPTAQPADELASVSSAEDERVIAAITRILDLGFPAAATDFNPECFATGIVETLDGAAGIEERYGITAEDFENFANIGAYDLDQVTAEQLTEAVWPCADYIGLFMAWDPAFMVAQDCLREEIPEDLAKKWMVASYMFDGGESLNIEPWDQLSFVAPAAAEACGVS